MYIDIDKLSYTTLEKIAFDYGYDGDINELIEKMEEETEKQYEKIYDFIIEEYEKERSEK